MSIELLESPLISSFDEGMWDSISNFPDEIYLISVGEGKYACNNATTPDGMTVNGLSCFPSVDDAISYMAQPGMLSGDTKRVSFEDAREIAKGKPVLDSLLLWDNSRIVEIHFVR